MGITAHGPPKIPHRQIQAHVAPSDLQLATSQLPSVITYHSGRAKITVMPLSTLPGPLQGTMNFVGVHSNEPGSAPRHGCGGSEKNQLNLNFWVLCLKLHGIHKA